MKRIVSNVVVAAVAGVLVGNGWAAEQPTAQEAMESLKAESRQAKFSMAGSRVARVYGQPLSFGTTPQDAAESFKARHAAVFGVEPGDLERAALFEGGALAQPVMYDPHTGRYKFTMIRYAHSRGGIPVFRSELRLLMRNEADSPLVLAVSSLRTLGKYTPDKAHLRGDFDPGRAAPEMERFSNPDTVIWAGVNDKVAAPRLARTFIAEKGGPGSDYEKWLYVVDAASTEVLYRESRIIFEDVVGNVSAMATEAPKPDFCSDELPTAMPYAMASIPGGSAAYADADGNYVITDVGTSAVTVISPMVGHYFAVTDMSGPDDVLSQSVNPPGPANFTHNAHNSSEFIRAQANAYIQANIVRDFTLTYNPDYPTLSAETHFPVYVNRTDQHCPGNAWYDYESINFCATGGGYPNTAFASVVHHEYGHHLVQCAGSGQGQYGEGMSDTIGVLIADDPVTGHGWYGDCDSGLRSAVNDLQYPCESGIHYCGQLLSGCIWDTRNELANTNPGSYLDILSNLTVNSILLHLGPLISPQITVDFLVLDDDDGDLSNGTPHLAEICTGFGAHSMDCPELITCDVPSDCPDDDGLFCTGPDCVSGLCLYVDDPCFDGDPCTEDVCDEDTDTCSNPPLVCPPSPNPCEYVFCHPTWGCTYVMDWPICADEFFCNGIETCSGDGECFPGLPPCSAECCHEDTRTCMTCDDDGVCEVYEDCYCCPGDCIGGDVPCGNGVCEVGDGENCHTCPQDCNGQLGGKPSDRYCCGDGNGPYGVDCDDPRCTAGGKLCVTEPAAASCCGDLVCEGIEDEVNCAVDCVPPVCGDSDCDVRENQCSCPDDCGTPPAVELICDDTVDQDCDGVADCDDGDCAWDPACVTLCGNGNCDLNEDQCNCPQDCGTPPSTETNCTDGVDQDCDGATDCDDGDCAGDPACVDPCGNGDCDPGEDQCNCPQDCGTPPSTETNCTDGIDEDCDGDADCDDPTGECDDDPACTPCAPKGDPCSIDDDCCSKKCRAGKCR